EETEDFPLLRLRNLTGGTRELAEKGEFLSAKEYPTGTSVSIELEGRYQKGRGSVDEFLELTAIANPHARIVFVPPSRESAAEEEDLPLADAKKDATHSEALNQDAAHVAPSVEPEKVTAPAGIDPTI